MATADRTVHLGAQTYELLREEAKRQHRDVDATADGLLAERLSSSQMDLAKLEQTLGRAARLRERLPHTEEAAALIREGRKELDLRSQRR